MATATALSRHLQLQFQVGTTSSGTPKLRNHNYAHVSPTAADDDVLAVGQALAGLFSDPLYAVARIDANALSASAPATA